MKKLDQRRYVVLVPLRILLSLRSDMGAGRSWRTTWNPEVKDQRPFMEMSRTEICGDHVFTLNVTKYSGVVLEYRGPCDETFMTCFFKESREDLLKTEREDHLGTFRPTEQDQQRNLGEHHGEAEASSTSAVLLPLNQCRNVSTRCEEECPGR